MAKRSTNFTGKKPMKGSAIIELMRWVGMSDDDIKKALEVEKHKQEQANAKR